MKVRIQNFQSIKDLSFEIKGLTALTGVNNTGKSAVARALMGLFTNARGNSFVRVGEKTCKVTLDFDDGNVVTWEKGKGTNKYEINGDLIERVGTGSPEEINFLGVSKTMVDGKEVWPQFARQFEQIFLLDLPPSVLSSALSNVEIIERLESASDLAKTETKSLNSQIQTKRLDLSKETKKLECFQGVDELEKRAFSISILENDIKENVRSISALSALRDRRVRVQSEIKILSDCSRILETDHSVSLPSLLEKILKISKSKSRRARLGLALYILEIGLSELEETPISYEFRSPLDRLIDLSSRRARFEKCLSEIPTLPDIPEDLEKEIRIYRLLVKRVKIWDALPLVEKEIEKISEEMKRLVGEICPLCERACDGGSNHG